jgi:hypothetical protein
MTAFPSLRATTPLLAAALCIAAAPAAHAQSGGWQFEASLYGWFPAISGTTSFPPNGGGPSIDVSMGDVVDALKFTFQGNFEARLGPWGLWTDLVYADFGASRQNSRDFTIGGVPASFDGNLVLDVKSWIWTLAGVFSLKDDAEGRADLVFGARMLDMTNGLSWNLNCTTSPPTSAQPTSAGRARPAASGGCGGTPSTGSAEAGVTNWDAVVGLKGRAMLGSERKWFVPYYVDVGSGESKLTWQVNAGIGYQLDWGALVATWRYLDYDFKNSSKVQDLSFSGPTIGAIFKF